MIRTMRVEGKKSRRMMMSKQKDDGSCPTLAELRKQDSTMNASRYASYKRGWLQVKNKRRTSGQPNLDTSIL